MKAIDNSPVIVTAWASAETQLETRGGSKRLVRDLEDAEPERRGDLIAARHDGATATLQALRWAPPTSPTDHHAP